MGQTSFLLMVLAGWLQECDHRWCQPPTQARTQGSGDEVSLWFSPAMGSWNHDTHRKIVFSGPFSGPSGWASHCQTPGSGPRLSVLLLPILGARVDGKWSSLPRQNKPLLSNDSWCEERETKNEFKFSHKKCFGNSYPATQAQSHILCPSYPLSHTQSLPNIFTYTHT